MNAAIIIIDSGFSAESLQGAGRVLAYRDLYDGRSEIGRPFLTAEQLAALAGDPMGHGSIVLQKIRQFAPDAPLVLIRGLYPQGGAIRTGWSNGRQVSPGWTEAYLWAVRLCNQAGLPTVANCSFGGFVHAADGTGWESFQLGTVCGAGKPGNVIVAAAGPGDGRAIHASWIVRPDETVTVDAVQNGDSRYNFWCDATGGGDWILDVRKDGGTVVSYRAGEIVANFWNGRRQITFEVPGEGAVQLSLSRLGVQPPVEARFDCWIASYSGAFTNHVDPLLICEPAIFPQVIAAGFRQSSYSPAQTLPGEKPDVLLEGDGAISFRIPALTALAARLLSSDPSLDCNAVRALIGKHPVLP